MDEALAALGITALTQRPTHMLSFGQKKRVAIAGLIAMRPDVLLLDEPTAGLDPSGVEDLMAVLSDLAARGTAIVVATHDMEAAYGFADRVAVVAGGGWRGKGCRRPCLRRGASRRGRAAAACDLRGR